MSDATDRTAALLRLTDWVQPESDPTLTDGEVERALDNNRLATTWAASTAYSVGDVVMPSPRDGHRYIVVKAGTSGTTQPTFSTYTGAQTGDGTVTWEEYGTQLSNIYDVRGAARECWRLKASKASERIGFSADGRSFQSQQLYEHCISQARAYGPIGVA